MKSKESKSKKFQTVKFTSLKLAVEFKEKIGSIYNLRKYKNGKIGVRIRAIESNINPFKQFNNLSY